MSTAHSKASLDRSYSPEAFEPKVRALWEKCRLGHAVPPEDRDSCYSIVIPPPNVTAALHLGHALNNTLQDILARFHRLQGKHVLWMPGTDHAGIATQTVVEKRLLREGTKRTDMEREAFIAVAQEWKDQYEAIILGQLRELGASCDWERARFTMDEVCAAAVRHAFFRLFADGLIERGKRLVNWDPVSGTALADDEVEMEQVDGHMWYLQYPLTDGSGHVTVATTRPETMLGDTAVAMHPDDPRAASLRGQSVRLPIVDRVIPIVEDEYVIMPGKGDDPKAEFATGFLKVTPAHDPNDWDIGQRHDLDIINVMAPDGSISDRHGWEDVSDQAKAFVGLSREAAREKIVDWFHNAGLLEHIRDYTHSVGHSYRSHVPIEPYLSDQWYVRVTDDRLCGEALRAMATEQHEGKAPARENADARQGDGQLRFYPSRYSRTFQQWHENLRDWCISRQLWWGHRIPVWTLRCPLQGDLPDGPLSAAPDGCSLPMCDHQDDALCVRLTVDHAENTVTVLACVDRGRPDIEEMLSNAGFEQDPDVLDTWFSSALWPMSTMGWPDPAAFPETIGLLDAFNPTDVLCTAREIITLWVSRMVMLNRYFLDGRLPFTDVTIHPMVQDGHGQKMSKSLGNGVDPRDIMHSHGTDALRLIMAKIATTTQDVRLPVDLVDPHSGDTFTPETITTEAGHIVAAPIQQSPSVNDRDMVTVYGTFVGEDPTDDRPLAKNTSSQFDAGRNFANKLWNAARFAMSKVESPAPVDSLDDLCMADRWMLTRLAHTSAHLENAMSEYRFNAMADALYDLMWRDFCDWYLEAIKPTVASSPQQQHVLLTVMDAMLRLLHPLCPYVTEVIWEHVRDLGPRGVPGLILEDGDCLAQSRWPLIDSNLACETSIADTQWLQRLVAEIRRIRSENEIPSKAEVGLLAAGDQLKMATCELALLTNMCRVDRVSDIQDCTTGSINFTLDGHKYAIDASGSVDPEAERARLQTRLDDLNKRIAGLNGRLSNAAYVEKAPAHLVEETRGQLATAEADHTATTAALEAIT
ncbi:MAG: valine--tRNA ligase [Phycisphaerales bacterium]|nr:valine--tRNA ligase [Phycisphaerales bacterium]